MRSRLRRFVWAALTLSVLATIALAGAVEVAKPGTSTGTSTVARGGKTSNVGSTTQFQEGDVVRVPAEGRLTIEFADGAHVTLIGPATFDVLEMNAKGRRVMLVSGVISEAQAHGVALEIQAGDPNDASMVLQNARGFARVNPGDKIVFQKLEGKYGKAWRDGKDTDLGDQPWQISVRPGVAAEGIPNREPIKWDYSGGIVPGKPPFVEKAMDHDGAMITNGIKAIVFHPASAFTRERTTEGGFRICFQGADDAFGVVEIGRETTLFLAKGECIDFDADGRIIRFSGIAHEYRPLFDTIYDADPVQDATDASPSFSRHR